MIKYIVAARGIDLSIFSHFNSTPKLTGEPLVIGQILSYFCYRGNCISIFNPFETRMG